jgi:hypothetical protein
MLRAVNSTGRPRPALTIQVFLLGALAGTALFSAGLQAPLIGATSNLVEEGSLQSKDRQPLTGEFLPANAVAAAAVRVPDLLRLMPGDEGRASIDDLPQLKRLGISIKDLDEFKIGVLDLNQGPGEPVVQICVRSLKPFEWLKALHKAQPSSRETEFAGVKYLVTTPRGGRERQLSYFMPDERTLVGAPDARIRELIQKGGKDVRPTWAENWDNVSNNPLVGMINAEVLRKFLDADRGARQDVLMMALAPLWQDTQVFVAGVSLDKTLTVQAVAETPSNEAGMKVARNLRAVATLGENFLVGFAKLAEQMQRPPAERAAVAQILAIVKELVGRLEIKEQGNLVELRTQSEKFGPKTVATLVLPVLLKMREEAERAVSTNNLKRIALAMHNYESSYGRFPAAVIMGPDGKTPHSWRVEILPYLEQNQLFHAYKMNEPWDSPNNKKVLEKMPDVFNATPNQPSTMSSYYVLTGKETAFPGEKGLRFTHITDGTSNTLLAVEAKCDIPWTKPEDLAYDAKKPLPKFGGYFQDGFNAALCDGSVRFLKNTVAERVMRALITASGGEVIPNF